MLRAQGKKKKHQSSQDDQGDPYLQPETLPAASMFSFHHLPNVVWLLVNASSKYLI